MRILAIDASTKSSGWAIFNGIKLEQYGCITASGTDLVKRISKMIIELDKILQNNNIEKIILEEVRPEEKGLANQTLKTHKALMYLQAAIVFLLHDRHPKIQLEFLYPSEWRAACGIKTGSGVKREDLKPADIAFAKAKFNIDVNDDIADAIGLGYAFAIDKGNRIDWE